MIKTIYIYLYNIKCHCHCKSKTNAKNVFAARHSVLQLIIAFYDKKRKRIVKYGTSRPCGVNYFKTSKHAEQLAIEYCEKNKSRNHEIYIWKYDKNMNIKSAHSCHSCTILANKYNYNIFILMACCLPLWLVPNS